MSSLKEQFLAYLTIYSDKDKVYYEENGEYYEVEGDSVKKLSPEEIFAKKIDFLKALNILTYEKIKNNL